MTPRLKCASDVGMAMSYIGRALDTDPDAERREQLRRIRADLRSYLEQLAASAKPDNHNS